jgi:hypothetical protein
MSDIPSHEEAMRKWRSYRLRAVFASSPSTHERVGPGIHPEEIISGGQPQQSVSARSGGSVADFRSCVLTCDGEVAGQRRAWFGGTSPARDLAQESTRANRSRSVDETDLSTSGRQRGAGWQESDRKSRKGKLQRGHNARLPGCHEAMVPPLSSDGRTRRTARSGASDGRFLRMGLPG